MKEAADLDRFLLPVLPSFCTAQLFHFTDGTFVPSTQRLNGYGDEGDAGAVALVKYEAWFK